MLAEVTTVLRTIGNIGAHASEIDVRPGYVMAIDKFFRAVIEYVYVAPKLVADFQQKLTALKSR